MYTVVHFIYIRDQYSVDRGESCRSKEERNKKLFLVTVPCLYRQVVIQDSKSHFDAFQLFLTPDTKSYSLWYCKPILPQCLHMPYCWVVCSETPFESGCRSEKIFCGMFLLLFSHLELRTLYFSYLTLGLSCKGCMIFYMVL